jgi:SAM-dependent methyltransferase
VRETLTDVLRCPGCRQDRTFSLCAEQFNDREVRAGKLTCRVCGGGYRVSDGIVDLLQDPPDFVRREAAGLERFAQVMRADGWGRARILALPDHDSGYWFHQKQGMQALLDSVRPEPGRRLLDVGANTCWASNIFARRGLDVIALDITKAELQGLCTAEYFLEQGDVHFERVLSVMFAPAIATESMDYVFCSEVLHHNDVRHLRRTMRECYRILRPGGQLLVMNEPLRFAANLKRHHAREVAQFDGHEHVFFFHQYYWAAKSRRRSPSSRRGP